MASADQEQERKSRQVQTIQVPLYGVDTPGSRRTWLTSPPRIYTWELIARELPRLNIWRVDAVLAPEGIVEFTRGEVEELRKVLKAQAEYILRSDVELAPQAVKDSVAVKPKEVSRKSQLTADSPTAFRTA